MSPNSSNAGLYRRRGITNVVALFLSCTTALFGLFFLAWILWTLVAKGISGINWQLFTQMTPPPNTPGGGLANAISGSLVLVGLATLVGTPIGILAGVYLAEYGQRTWLGRTTRFINGILDERAVHDGKHFLGDSFGRGQETSAKSGDRENSFANGFHARNLSRCFSLDPPLTHNDD